MNSTLGRGVGGNGIVSRHRTLFNSIQNSRYTKAELLLSVRKQPPEQMWWEEDWGQITWALWPSRTSRATLHFAPSSTVDVACLKPVILFSCRPGTLSCSPPPQASPALLCLQSSGGVALCTRATLPAHSALSCLSLAVLIS